MAALRSSRCLSSTWKAFYFDNPRSFEGCPFGSRSALFCSSSTSYSVRKSSSTRRSLNQNGRARGPIPCNSKARRRDVAFWAKAAAVERLVAAEGLAPRCAALLVGIWSLFNFRINTIGNQVLKAFHNPDTATPFHFNPVHFAVGAGALLLLMTFGVYKWAKNSGTEKPVDVPIQRRDGIGTTNNIGNRHAPTDNHPTNRVQEGEALPTQRRDGVGTMNNIGNWQAPTDNHPINGARKGEALPRKKTVNLSVNFVFFNDGDGPNGTIISS